ncbi:glycosyltransferase family 4 protein [Tamlana sp. 2201CG12-4]|uniref:glycosyltransferase family 4 protein n=1 Tax=Tamlana sp. 2201CG12-4 TaxID=3112582 RepID=UPI002DB8C2C5|nr:glycosyltransferase family 4 protein [Tamlana sp. 2201CG12-4]MEC3907333.1 glycosyltransferase family 4 protein [Tamlana sp. 2201CG12-4]
MVRKLVVIPSDLISDYESKGTSSWLRNYYNPMGFFDKVYVLSPIEKEFDEKYGLKIVPVISNRDFRNKLKKINPICVRAYGGYWATDYANYNRVTNIPVVSSVHDTNLKLMYESLKYSDFILSMSQVVSNVLLENDLAKKEHISVLGNRVDTSLFKKMNIDKSILSSYEIPLDKRIILHVGRKSVEKNIENVIKTLNYLEDEFILLLLGAGDFKPYEKQIEELDLKERVFNIEKIENNKLPLFYNIAEVLCVPSRWEGFGLVFVEAASCLTKIVTSNKAPMSDYLVNDGVMNTLINDYETPRVIAKAVLNLVNNKSQNSHTRNVIVEKFDQKVISNREIDFYKTIVYRNIRKRADYRKWYVKRWCKLELLPVLRKIKKLPKRLWLKVRSYQ